MRSRKENVMTLGNRVFQFRIMDIKVFIRIIIMQGWYANINAVSFVGYMCGIKCRFKNTMQTLPKSVARF